MKQWSSLVSMVLVVVGGSMPDQASSLRMVLCRNLVGERRMTPIKNLHTGRRLQGVE